MRLQDHVTIYNINGNQAIRLLAIVRKPLLFLIKERQKSLQFYLGQSGNSIIATTCLLKSTCKQRVAMALSCWRQVKIIADYLSQLLRVPE